MSAPRNPLVPHQVRSVPMSEQVLPLWAVPLLPLGLIGLGAVAAVFDAAGGAHAAGRPLASALATPAREALRLLATQRVTTRLPDALLWRIGSAAPLVVAVLASVTVPLAPGLVLADLSIGVVWWTAFVALLWVAVHLCGWGANSALPMVAGYRFVAQALAYEMPLAITIVAVALPAESLSLSQIAAAQSGLWYVVWIPAGFLVYLLCAAALSFWGPFATPLGADAAGGVLAELAGPERLLFLAGRYTVLGASAWFAVPLFLGGGAGPLLPAWLWTVLKTLAVLALLVGVRWRLPLVRMDRFEELAWVVLIPVTLAQLFVVCVIVLLR